VSTNFAWKHEYDVKLWRHKQRTPNKNDHHLPLNEIPHENFLRTPLMPIYIGRYNDVADVSDRQNSADIYHKCYAVALHSSNFTQQVKYARNQSKILIGNRFHVKLRIIIKKTSNKRMFSIIVTVLFAMRIYSNSVNCLPKYALSVGQPKSIKPNFFCLF